MDPIDERLTRAGAAWRDAQARTEAPVAIHHPATPRWTPRIATVAPLAGLVVAVLAVVGVLWAVSPRQALDVAASPSPRPVALLTEQEPALACYYVHIGGVLQRDPETGLGIVRADGTAMPVRWPFGWSSYEQAGRVVLVDDAGSPVAIDGDPIGFGSAGRDQGIQTACRPSLDGSRSVPGEARTGNAGRAFTETELLALVRMRAAGSVVPEVVVADVTIVPAIADDAPALVGLVGPRGSAVFITADATLLASLPGDNPLSGVFAFDIEDDAFRLLGPVTPAADGSYAHALVDLASTPSDQPELGTLIAVDGWLTSSPVRCPDSSGSDCRAVRIADVPADPELAVPVQDAAWHELGAIPGLDVELPRHGVYLLQRVEDGEQREWAAVARLDPVGTISVALPTVPEWTGFCRGVGAEARLTGDRSDPRVTWLVDDSGARLDIIWPPGYTARFTPALEVLTSDGFVRLREGDRVEGGCPTGPDALGPLLIAPAQ